MISEAMVSLENKILKQSEELQVALATIRTSTYLPSISWQSN
jgi:hypothetical protein